MLPWDIRKKIRKQCVFFRRKNPDKNGNISRVFLSYKTGRKKILASDFHTFPLAMLSMIPKIPTVYAVDFMLYVYATWLQNNHDLVMGGEFWGKPQLFLRFWAKCWNEKSCENTITFYAFKATSFAPLKTRSTIWFWTSIGRRV